MKVSVSDVWAPLDKRFRCLQASSPSDKVRICLSRLRMTCRRVRTLRRRLTTIFRLLLVTRSPHLQALEEYSVNNFMLYIKVTYTLTPAHLYIYKCVLLWKTAMLQTVACLCCKIERATETGWESLIPTKHNIGHFEGGLHSQSHDWHWQRDRKIHKILWHSWTAGHFAGGSSVSDVLSRRTRLGSGRLSVKCGG